MESFSEALPTVTIPSATISLPPAHERKRLPAVPLDAELQRAITEHQAGRLCRGGRTYLAILQAQPYHAIATTIWACWRDRSGKPGRLAVSAQGAVGEPRRRPVLAVVCGWLAQGGRTRTGAGDRHGGHRARSRQRTVARLAQPHRNGDRQHADSAGNAARHCAVSSRPPCRTGGASKP